MIRLMGIIALATLLLNNSAFACEWRVSVFDLITSKEEKHSLGEKIILSDLAVKTTCDTSKEEPRPFAVKKADHSEEEGTVDGVILKCTPSQGLAMGTGSSIFHNKQGKKLKEPEVGILFLYDLNGKQVKLISTECR